MNIFDNTLYKEDIHNIAKLNFPWQQLKNKTLLITGATGMIGSFMIDVIMYKNDTENLQCNIISLGRSIKKGKERFKKFCGNKLFEFIECNINEPIHLKNKKIDYIIHAASNTHPVAYASDPIGTVITNIIGTYNLLELGCEKSIKRFIFTSSVEVYGENRGDVDEFNEEYLGYINCNTLRAGYPESKRAGEALCQAYMKQKNIDFVIPRLARTFGPTMLMSDTKAISQFIKSGVEGKDIVLKSEGNQYYSYNYVADSVSGILACLFWGDKGEAYNISDHSCNITLKNLANLIANYSKKSVIFEIPKEEERAGYSKATKAIMDSKKIRKIGWKPLYDMEESVIRTIKILSSVYL